MALIRCPQKAPAKKRKGVRRQQVPNLVDLSEMEFNPGTEIKPQPPEMKMSAMDLSRADKDEEAKPEAFMTERCKLAPLKLFWCCIRLSHEFLHDCKSEFLTTR